VGLEQDPLSLMSTVEELLGRNSSGSSLESREYSLRELYNTVTMCNLECELC
jgi:hypothetical protein